MSPLNISGLILLIVPKAGVPTIAIMKITGNPKESTFLRYIKVSAEENAEMLRKHPFFIE